MEKYLINIIHIHQKLYELIVFLIFMVYVS